jgi:hypothetical protein
MIDFKLRASSGSVLLTNPRSKADKDAGVLSLTAQTLVQDWYKYQIYGIKKDIHSKYTDKGNIMEQVSLQKAADYFGLGMILETNKQYFEDAFFTGTPDLIRTDEIIDIKNSWDFSTFPLFAKEIPTKGYIIQMQIYMHLTGRKKARVIYCLSNTPENLIIDDIYYRIKDMEKMGIKLGNEERELFAEQIRMKHNYDRFDDKYRYREFKFVYDADIIESLWDRVAGARKYLETIIIK